ncbi:MAG: PCMD domain-containing protein, partial [Duncaniella sp.]|nr:PCMD domain-containing protein [Duncaniella sp.]
TDVLPNIPCEEGASNTSVFTVSITDRYSKTCDPVSFSVDVEKLEMQLLQGSIIADGRLTLLMKYNGGDVENVRFKAKNSRGTYTELIVNKISGTAPNYEIDLTHPASDPVIKAENTLEVKADKGSLSSIVIAKSPVMIADQAATNAFAKRAFLGVKFTDDAVMAQSDNVEWYLSTDNGTTYNKAASTARKPAGRAVVGSKTYELTGLRPATAYMAYAKLGEEQTFPIEFTTEAAAQLPNAGMEDWYTEDVYTNKTAWVGMTDIKRWFANAKGESFWATRNALTTAQNSGTTCYYTSFSGTVPVSGISGQAAEISTLGYGEGSTYGTKSGNGIIKHTAAGMLFIGDHSASSETDEEIAYGKPFTSRPSALKFAYKFAPYNGESFKAYIVIEHRDGAEVKELGRGEIVSGNEVTTFTEVEVPVNYTDLSAKATHAYVVFLSSTADKPSVKGVTGSKGAFDGFSDSKRIGNVLTIDDIELIY